MFIFRRWKQISNVMKKSKKMTKKYQELIQKKGLKNQNQTLTCSNKASRVFSIFFGVCDYFVIKYKFIHLCDFFNQNIPIIQCYYIIALKTSSIYTKPSSLWYNIIWMHLRLINERSPCKFMKSSSNLFYEKYIRISTRMNELGCRKQKESE